jgi:hypothetical protein
MGFSTSGESCGFPLARASKITKKQVLRLAALVQDESA